MLLPQLQSRAVVQRSVTRRAHAARVVNRLEDGSLLMSGMLRSLRHEWDLEYVGLTDSELFTLEDFANAARGMEGGFTFIDPMANMLTKSEDLTGLPWIQSAYCDVTSEGVGEEGYSVHGVASQSAGVESVSQDVNVAGQGWMSGSCWVRATEAVTGSLIMNSGAEEWRSEFVAKPEWNRLRVSAMVSTGSGPLRFSIEAAPGARFDVMGVQLEHQAFPSEYKPSRGDGGIHQGARIVDGSFSGTRQAPDWCDCHFRIEVD